MLVIISDLHLKDGTFGETLPPNVFRAFCNRLQDMAYRASWRAGGRYRPVETIDVLLLGDVFDYRLSWRWHKHEAGDPGYIRPWDAPDSPAYIAAISDVTQGILQNNQTTFRILRQLSAGERVTLPPAIDDRLPDKRAPRLPVKVNIYYLVGNHDWFLHLPGAPYNEIRTEIARALGLATDPDAPFPHAPEESPVVQSVQRRHRVFARHGDIFDPLNYNPAKGRNAPSLMDALDIEVWTLFPLEVSRRLGNQVPAEVYYHLGDLTHIRPPSLAPLWVDNLLKSYIANPQIRHDIKNIWDELVTRFARLDFVRGQKRKTGFDSTDLLRNALLFSRFISTGTVGKIVDWATGKIWNGDYSLAAHALNEPAFLRQEADFIIYGHTHIHEIVPLDTDAIVYSKGRVYTNTGSWLRGYHATTNRRRSIKGFVALQEITGAAFFTGDEHGGQPFEIWSESVAAWSQPMDMNRQDIQDSRAPRALSEKLP